MEKVRVGIIGAGKMGRTHLDALRDVQEAQAVALVDTAGDADAGPKLAAEYGIKCEKALDALLGRKDIDAVVVATPHSLHADHAVAAFKAGKHVLLEKPMELTLDRCDAIIRAARESRRKLMVAQSHRYWEGDALSKRLLDEGAIGKLVMCRDVLAGPGYRKPGRSWQSDPRLYGPGGLIAWGVHDVDRLRWWFGSEADAVFARSFALRTEIPGDITSNMIAITFGSGGCAHLWYSEALPPPGWEGFACCAQLVGEAGIMDVDPYNSVKVARRGSDKWETVYTLTGGAAARQKAFAGEDRDFIRSIVNDGEPPVTGKDGRAAVEIVLAAYRSSETGAAVKLPMK